MLRTTLGDELGSNEDNGDGLLLGSDDRLLLGSLLGNELGCDDGIAVGSLLGNELGCDDGIGVGSLLGNRLGAM